MIRRALQSLIAQDHQNWVCEVHNDWPDDAATIQGIVDSPVSYTHLTLPTILRV